MDAKERLVEIIRPHLRGLLIGFLAQSGDNCDDKYVKMCDFELKELTSAILAELPFIIAESEDFRLLGMTINEIDRMRHIVCKYYLDNYLKGVHLPDIKEMLLTLVELDIQ